MNGAREDKDVRRLRPATVDILLRRMCRHYVLLLVLASCAVSAPRPWLRATSNNFELYTNSGEKRAREVLVFLEQVRGFFLKVSPQYHSDVPVRIIAFNSENDYKPYRMNEFAAAYYAGGSDRDHIVLGPVGPQVNSVAVHEYVHLLMKPAGPKIPVWLDEGLAQVFETLRPYAGKGVMVGEARPELLYQLTSSRWLSPNTVLGARHDSAVYNDSDRAGLFYAQSWALVHMLLLTNEYRPKFAEVMDALTKGEDPETAFTAAWGKGVPEIWKELQGYVQRGQFNVGTMDRKLEKAVETPSVGPADPVEASLVLANLLASMRDKQDAAQSAYEELARSNPRRPEVFEGLGYLSLRAQKTEGAKLHFARAASLGSRNAQMYFDLGQISSGQECVSALEKAIELKPDHVEARLRLGYALLSLEKFAEAREALASVKRIDAARAFNFFRAVAYANYRLGKADQARQHAESARKFAKTESERAEVDTLIDVLSRGVPAAADDGPAQSGPGAPRTVSRELRTSREEVMENPSVEGLLTSVDCIDGKARLRVLVGGREVRFAITDPSKVVIQGRGGTVDFTCGAQTTARRVRIEFGGKVNAELGTTGDVLLMEFK